VILGHECANELNSKIIDYGTAQVKQLLFEALYRQLHRMISDLISNEHKALEEVLSIPVFEVSVDDVTSLTNPLISLVTQIMERRERQVRV